MIRALFTLMACQLAGEGIRAVTSMPLPGPVIGMLVLAGVLVCRRRQAAMTGLPGSVLPDTDLQQTARHLIANMGLLFVPAGVGIITQADILRAQWLPIAAGLAGSTVLGLVVTALLMHRLLKAPSAPAPVEDRPA